MDNGPDPSAPKPREQPSGESNQVGDEPDANNLDPSVKQLLEENPVLGEVVEKYPELKRRLQITSMKFHGPLPHPSILQQYDKIAPGIANRIITMAEKDSEHIRYMQRKSLLAKMLEVTLGQIFAFGIGLATLAASVFLTTSDHAIVGTLLGTGGLAGLVSVFIWGRTRPRIPGEPNKERPQN